MENKNIKIKVGEIYKNSYGTLIQIIEAPPHQDVREKEDEDNVW